MKKKKKFYLMASVLFVFCVAMIQADVMNAKSFINYFIIKNNYVECTAEITEVSDLIIESYHRGSFSNDAPKFNYHIKQSFSYSYEYEGKNYDTEITETICDIDTDYDPTQEQFIEMADGKEHEKEEQFDVLINPQNPNEHVFKDEFEGKYYLQAFIVLAILNAVCLISIFLFIRYIMRRCSAKKNV